MGHSLTKVLHLCPGLPAQVFTQASVGTVTVSFAD